MELRSDDLSSRVIWGIAVLLPIAAVSRSAVPWSWGFPVLYFGMAFVLHVLVRVEDQNLERLAHIIVLSGSGPFVLRWFFGESWHTASGFAHVASVFGVAVLAGYWLASRIRPVRRSSHAV